MVHALLFIYNKLLLGWHRIKLGLQREEPWMSGPKIYVSLKAEIRCQEKGQSSKSILFSIDAPGIEIK